MRPVRLLAAVALAVGIVAAAVFYLRPVELAAQPQQPRGRVSQCNGTITGTLSANTIRICDPLTVTVNVAPVCPVCPGGINVVYVQVDKAIEAGWMVRESLSSLNELRNWNGNYKIQVGVVHYNTYLVRRALDMTDQINAARSALSVPFRSHDPTGDFKGAARMALDMITDARDDLPDNSAEPCEFIIFFASTKSLIRQSGEEMLEAAGMIHGEGIELFVGCPETIADYCTYTEQMPKGRDKYTQASDRGKLSRMVARKMDELVGNQTTVRDKYMTQVLPPGLEYIDGSASEVPLQKTTSTDNSTTLNWAWYRVRSTDPHTITYRAKPLAEGTWPVTGSVRLVDTAGRQREMPMATVPITVSGLCLPPPSETPTDLPIPTPVPTEVRTPTPTPTATFAPTPTPTRTASPTPTATPTPKPIYIPILVNEQCSVQVVYSDVVLVLDMSTSMNRGTGGGRTKLEATLEAAKVFLTLMDLTPGTHGRSDRIAIVGFNAKAWVESPLTNDAGALHQAIDRLPDGQAQLTRLDLGFEVGLQALLPALGQPNTTLAIVFLTDGLPNQVPPDPEDGTMETTVRKAAQRAKDAGARIYTIAIGLPEDINATLMGQCATGPGDFFYTPDPEALAGIYAQIAFEFGCPKGRHDWGQSWP